MSYQLIRGNALSLPLADESVDLICTSPPYFALRSYTDGGEHYEGQIGSEATPQAFLEALWAVTAECVRVLKPSGSLWVNLGDKYAGSGGHNNSGISDKSTLRGNGHTGGGPKIKATRRSAPDRYNRASDGIPAKSLMLLPQRYAIGCIDQLGLICRAEVIWSKPNGLPESVTDRVRRSHEQWFMFTKRPRYFSAVDEIRELRSGEVVEAPPQHLPGCPLFVGPSDTLTTVGVQGGHEGNPGVQHLDLAHHVGANVGVHGEHVMGAEQEGQARSLGAPAVPLLVGGEPEVGHDGAHLLHDGDRPVVDGHSQVGRAGATVAEAHGALSVDDPGEPGKVCTCGHATYHTGALGKLPGSVWTVPTEPLRVPDHLGVDHFAAFPSEWPRRIILGWSPSSGVCVACGEGRRPVVERTPEYEAIRGPGTDWNQRSRSDGNGARGHVDSSHVLTGYACACPNTDAPTRPAVVLDPFAGTGTTVAVAHALGRHGIGIDLSADYLRLAEWRCNNLALAEKVADRSGMAAPKGEHEGMEVQPLFGGAS